MATFGPGAHDYTIATSGTYAIDVAGAQGGAATVGSHSGGLGAAVGGEIFLTAGTQLEINVGDEGGIGSLAGGGGGGSYIFETDGGEASLADLLAAAGGGGGAGKGADGAEGVGHASGHTPGVGGVYGGGGGVTGGGGGSLSEASTNGKDDYISFAGGGGSGGGGGGGYGGGGGGGSGPTTAHGGGGGGGGGVTGGSGGGHSGGGGGGGSILATEVFDQSGFSGIHGGNGLVTITPVNLVCFCSGTQIRTPRGELAVEKLAVGDLALTSEGRARAIVWTGSRTISAPSPEQWPVRVMAGAFGENRPTRDLWLSPGHAVCLNLIEEVFVPVGGLVNGATIVREAVSEVTYWHVELESHDVLLAEGMPCESYMDAGNRAWFFGGDGWADPERVEASFGNYARPFVDDPDVLATLRRRLAARAGRSGWARTEDMDLHLLVDGGRINPVIEAGVACFAFSPEVRTATLCSRTFSPMWIGDGQDDRQLGVRMRGLRLGDGRGPAREVALGDLEGFHDEEVEGDHIWRWTSGPLEIPAHLWSACQGVVILAIATDPSAGWAWQAPKAAATPHLRAIA